MENPPHAAIYVNNTLIPPATIEQISIPYTDILAISLAAHPSFWKPTLSVNLYNDPRNHSATKELQAILLHHIKIDNYDVILIGGDFNLHHSLWNPAGYTAQDADAETLVETMMEANLRPFLPLGTITRIPPQHNSSQLPTAIDLIWSNKNAEDILVNCHTVEETKDHRSNHYPIEITLDLSSKKLPPTQPPYDYNNTNWDLVQIERQCILPPP